VQRSLIQSFNNGITLSIGLAQFHPELRMEDFINIADKAMYDAKRKGGNQIALARLPSAHSLPKGAFSEPPTADQPPY
jgi:PleD family two-component response regulator